MRKRFALLVMALTTVAVLAPATPAAATTCYIGDPPNADDVYCVVFNEPLVRALCYKLPVC